MVQHTCIYRRHRPILVTSRSHIYIVGSTGEQGTDGQNKLRTNIRQQQIICRIYFVPSACQNSQTTTVRAS